MKKKSESAILELKKLIAKNQSKKAISKIITYCEESKGRQVFQKYAIVMASELRMIEHDRLLGESMNKEINRVNYKLLELIDLIEEEYASDDEEINGFLSKITIYFRRRKRLLQARNIVFGVGFTTIGTLSIFLGIQVIAFVFMFLGLLILIYLIYHLLEELIEIT